MNINVSASDNFPCYSKDSDYENANRSADVDVELMAFHSIIEEDYKGHDNFCNLTKHCETWTYRRLL